MPANIGGLLTAGNGDKGLRRRFADWGKTNLERLWITNRGVINEPSTVLVKAYDSTSK